MTMREPASRLLCERYELRSPLGKGGTAYVYEAYDTLLQRRVAVKQLRSTLWHDQQACERFLHEAKVAAGLLHPGIASIYDVGDEEQGPFLVQELVEGQQLDQAMPLPPDLAVYVAACLAETLDFIHQHDIVHCDVKPQNVMLTPDERVVLLDFGIAEAPGAHHDELYGTPHYLAPERAQGAPATPAADVYALGVLLYELLTGKVPFDGQTPQEIMLRHIQEGVPPLRRAAPGMALELEGLLARATARDPAERPAMRELADELQELLQLSTRATAAVPVVRQRLTVPIRTSLDQPSTEPIPLVPRAASAASADRAAPAPMAAPGVASARSDEHATPAPAASRPLAGRLPQSLWQRRWLLPLLLPLFLLPLLFVLRDDLSTLTDLSDASAPGFGPAGQAVAQDAPEELGWPEVSAEPFDSARWPQGRNGSYILEYVDGRYHMWMAAGVNMVWSQSPGGLPGGELAVTLEVDPREGAAGLLFGFEGPRSHYRLLTSADGAYRLERRSGGGVESLASGKGAGKGRLGLALRGRLARIFFDDQLLGELELPGEPGRGFGLIVAGDGVGEAFFDNLTVRARG